MHNVIDRLMWIVLEQKYIKLNTFFYFALAGTSALNGIFNILTPGKPISKHQQQRYA